MKYNETRESSLGGSHRGEWGFAWGKCTREEFATYWGNRIVGNSPGGINPRGDFPDTQIYNEIFTGDTIEQKELSS